MNGVVDVGGGLRGVYGAGVFDYCMDHGISFDTCVGVSAGAANILSYSAGQRGRNYVYYTEYAFRKEYMGMRNLTRRGGYINLDYIYGTLSNADGEYPLAYDKVVESGKQIEMVATNAHTGNAVYFGLKDMAQDHYDPVKASCCVPVVNLPYEIDGVPYYDGGISDPVPVNRAFRLGCDKVVVILTRPRDAYRSPKKDARMARMLLRQYPKSAYRLAHRSEIYNKELDLARRYEERGKALIVAPKSIQGMKTLNKDKAALEFLYKAGYEDAAKIEQFLS